MTNVLVAVTSLLALVVVIILAIWAAVKMGKEQLYNVTINLNSYFVTEKYLTWDEVEESKAFWPTIFPDCEIKVFEAKD